MATLDLDELIGASLAEARKTLPSAPRIVQVLHRVGKDHAGDDAVFVTVVLGDETPEDQLNWRALGPTSRRLADAAQHAYQFQIEAIPYVRFVTEAQAKDEGLSVP